MRVIRSVLAAALCLAATRSTLAAEPPAAPPAPAASPGISARPFTAKETTEAIQLLRNYLQAEHTDRTTFRLAMKAWIDAKLGGTPPFDPLADIDGLQQAIYQARPFDAPYEKKHLPRDAKFLRDEVNRITSTSFTPTDQGEQGETERFSFSLPPKYDPKKAGPHPTIVMLHDLVDFEEGTKIKEFPGSEVIRRRYPRQGALKSVTEEWITFAPVSTKARFGSEWNRRIVTPFAKFWKRYHVDFDRVVLDGGDDVLQVAVSIPVFFSGLIVRGDPGDLDPKLGVNIAHLPIYVVGDDKGPAAKWLKAANLTPKVGPQEGLVEWLREIRDKPRKTPTEFKWYVKVPSQQSLAHWVNLNQAVPDSEISVKAVKADNAIVIEAKGIEDVSIFLNDRILDLGKPVKMKVNGKDVPITLPTTKSGVPKRDLDVLFENDRLSIRKSRYYGWLFPILSQRIKVPEPPAPETTKPTKPTEDGKEASTGETKAEQPEETGSAEEREATAATYFQKAEEAEKTGNVAKALSLYEKALAQGETSFRARAEAKIKALKAPAPPADPTKPGASTK